MTTAVSAYAATSATEPLTKTTITRRDVGPHDVAFDIHFAGICHSDIHTVRGEWGEVEYPHGARSRDRRHRHRGRLRGHQVQGRRPRRRRLLRRLLPRVRVLPGRRGAVLHQPGHGRHVQRRRPRRRSRPRAATAARSSSTRTTCCASPTRSRWTRPHRCCARASPCTRRCGTGAPGPGKQGRGHRPRRARPHGRQARGRAGRRGHRAQPVAEEDGGRAAARRRPSTTRPATADTFKKLAGIVRPDPQHRLGQPRHGRLPRPARRSTARWSNSACPRSRWRSRPAR